MTTTEAPRSDADDRAALKGVGLRVTEQRLAVLRALEGRPHSAADEVHAHVVDDLPGTSLQAVYVVLAALTGAGLVRRIEPAGSPARYERRIGDNHHHVVCSVCGTVGDVDCVVGHAPCLTPSNDDGFVVQAAEVTFWGLCPACAAGEGETPVDDAPSERADGPAATTGAGEASPRPPVTAGAR